MRIGDRAAGRDARRADRAARREDVPDVFAPAQDEPSEEQPIEEHAREDITSTLTMADLYAGQGLIDEARHIYENILLRDPDNEAVRAKLAALDATAADAIRRSQAGAWLAKVGAARGGPCLERCWPESGIASKGRWRSASSASTASPSRPSTTATGPARRPRRGVRRLRQIDPPANTELNTGEVLQFSLVTEKLHHLSLRRHLRVLHPARAAARRQLRPRAIRAVQGEASASRRVDLRGMTI